MSHRITLVLLAFGMADRLPAQVSPARDSAVRDLRNVFAPGFMLQDRNGDDVIDFVNAKIVLPASASDAEAAAAANIAARLGYETSASNLDLAVFDNQRVTTYDVPVVLIGARNAMLSRAALGSAALGLAPGEGAVAFIGANETFRRGGVAIVAADASGLIAAANNFSSRYPSVWAVRASTYADLADRVTRYLQQRNVAATSVSVEQLVVGAGRRGVARAQIRVRVADSATVARAIVALDVPDSAARDTTGRGGGGRAGAGAVRDSSDAATATPAPGGGRGRLRRADLDVADLHRVDVVVVGGTTERVVRLLPARPWQTRASAEWAPRESPDFALSDLYTIRGLYRDTNQDLVPDRMEAHLSIHGGESPAGLVALAERIGLETAGIRLPLADVGGQSDYPQDAGFPIVFGVGHYQTDRLIKSGKLAGNVNRPGEGFIQFAKGAFGGRNGLVIGAPDKAGLDAITDYAAKRLPYLWEYGKGKAQLADVEDEVRRFVQAKDGAGQTALALHKVDTWLTRLWGMAIDSIGVELAAKDRYEGVDRYVENLARQHFPSAKTTVKTYKTGFGVGKQIFAQEFDVPWEVDAFWKVFRSDALPKLSAGSKGRIEVRLSESPQMRGRIAQDIRRALATKGLAPSAYDIVVLSAYKQGFSWLNDEILPQLKDRPIGRVEITYRSLKDSREVRWQVVESDTRWLQELYPIDAVMAKELGIADSLITFTATQDQGPVYRVRVLGRDGSEMLKASFSPKYVVRPMFDLVPDYEHVRVTTGWVNVVVNNATIVDQRIKTDAESFWDVLQSDTYKRIADYVMDVQQGRPSSGNAPYFDELRVEMTMSEPDYRLGIDEEVISSLEAIHEDIYFETLTLFNLIGGRYNAGTMDYAGRIIPMIKPSVDGKAGHVRITFTGKERGVPELVFAYRERGRESVRDEYPLSALPTEAPRLRGVTVKAGATDGVSQLLFDVVALDSLDRYAEFKARGSEESIDRTFLSADLLSGMVRTLDALHRAGVAEEALSFDRVGELLFRVSLRDTTATFTRLASLPRSRRPASTATPVLTSRGYRPTGGHIVQWDTPIPPPESDSILAKLGTFPGVTPYFVGKSFLGKNIFAADFLPEIEAKFVSQAKLNALKPTVLLSGRQHANEVSSTSHILRIGELLVTDSSYRRLLKKVNVVLHPITNPDGAQLAYDLQKITPDFMLHAGYLGALGVDATSGAGNPDAIYPESQVRPLLQEMWLPDIFMNLHGYPSHEWVQYFAGYSGWVRGRTGTQRSWWSPRGWFVPGFTYVEDKRNPEFERAQFAILDSVAAAITSSPRVNAVNKRLYARYQKYGKQDDENFREFFRNGILVYQALRGRELGGGGGAGGGRGGAPGAAAAAPAGDGSAAGALNSPRVTYFSVTTEAPDETARGAWLELVATAGVAHTSALIRYLAAGVNDVRRDVAEYDGVVTRSVARRKPVTPRDPSPRAAPNP
jgi:hypothetical protein